MQSKKKGKKYASPQWKTFRDVDWIGESRDWKFISVNKIQRGDDAKEKEEDQADQRERSDDL